MSSNKNRRSGGASGSKKVVPQHWPQLSQMVPGQFGGPAMMGQGPAMMAQGPNGSFFTIMPAMQHYAQQPSSSSSSSATKRRKAWIDDEEDDDEEEDEQDDPDFKAKSKTRLSLPKGKRRDSGSLSAQQQMAMKKVRELPDKFMGRPVGSQDNDTDCVSCKEHLGEVMLLPCGHGNFCTKCVNKLHDKSHKLKRLQLCPVTTCLDSITGWVKLRNIMV